MGKILKTVFHDNHVRLGAKMMEFGGWDMPLQYEPGIIQEHLATRKKAGLFDVSHMGRFSVRGKEALPLLQHVLTNNAAALEVGQSQYTIIPNKKGGAIDDAYLYRFYEDEYLLVVNASNRETDWNHIQSHISAFDVEIDDITDKCAMLSLQGPLSKKILLELLDSGPMPEPIRNYLSIVVLKGIEVLVARTGYTGEPICFELFIESKDALAVWNMLLDEGAQPVGLGARDTLRLEAGLPLYGHELGNDPEGNEIPIFAMGLSRFAVSFSPLKKDFIGKKALKKQFTALKGIIERDYSKSADLPRIIMPVLVTGKGVGRAGSKVFRDSQHVGHITSGTTVPYWKYKGDGISSKISDEKGMRTIAMALLDCDILEGDQVEIEVRRGKAEGTIVPYHLRSEAPPYSRAILNYYDRKTETGMQDDSFLKKAKDLILSTIDNTKWRQHECINLIPSEQTPSAATRLLSIMDPSGRYAEHRQIKAFEEADVFFYQGTDFIGKVETLLNREFSEYLGCSEVESRAISGQMANTVFFSALVDYLNRTDRKGEPRRIKSVLNNHIIRGGHLSAQPSGALRDYVAFDPLTEKHAVVNFPVMADDPYRIDIQASRDIIARHKPELIILGKSMTLYREPVSEIRDLINECGLNTILMYDMAHVLGLVGPHFQQPFLEGADIVTGSTHKTFYGMQRGIIASNWQRLEHQYELWEAIQRRAFPGGVSNHHLGTLLGLLMATYEMKAFRDEYQSAVLSNARAFARALKDCGMKVAGDPDRSYTETHQVILNVGYAKGPKIAHQLERNNIIVNYQAVPEEEGFTAAGAIRMGVAEMTRFGMEKDDFTELARMIHDIIVKGKELKDEVSQFRKRFTEMKYCFSIDEIGDLVQQLHELI